MLRFSKKRVFFVAGGLILALSFAFAASAADFSVNATADGLESLVLSDASASFNVSLVTVGATACEMTAPALSGVATGASFNVAPGDPWYPTAGGSTTFSFSCDDGAGVTLSDSVTVSLATASVVSSTADIKANNSDGPVTITSGDSYTLSWSSSNATSCEITSPALSGVSLSGSSTIDPTHLFYPAVGSPVTITMTCTNGTSTDTDSVEINIGVVPPPPPPPPSVTADIKANGSDGPITVDNGNYFDYDWTSSNATACEITSPALSGIALSGGGRINPGHSWYPAVNNSVTITISCTDGVSTDTDSVLITITSVGGGGGGGGGSCPLPSIINPLSVSGRVGDSFSYLLTATSTSSSTPI
ncbi:MAG: hypothetical protein AAB690_01550, partial [Patescibacteria group bacterium]